MPPGIRCANLKETFALTDVIPSTSEALKTRNIVSAIVDFVQQFKLLLINTFFPERSFQALELQCEIVLSAGSKYVKQLEYESGSDLNDDDDDDNNYQTLPLTK